MELTEGGDLYTSVTLPNIMVGTVGGGTGLPSAKACLNILGLSGPGHSNALAEVCVAIVLAGEIVNNWSILLGRLRYGASRIVAGHGPEAEQDQ